MAVVWYVVGRIKGHEQHKPKSTIRFNGEEGTFKKKKATQSTQRIAVDVFICLTKREAAEGRRQPPVCVCLIPAPMPANSVFEWLYIESE